MFIRFESAHDVIILFENARNHVLRVVGGISDDRNSRFSCRLKRLDDVLKCNFQLRAEPLTEFWSFLLTDVGHDAIGEIELADLYAGGDQYVAVFDSSISRVAKVGDAISGVAKLSVERIVDGKNNIRYSIGLINTKLVADIFDE
jgi:hypothetical protein